MDFKSDITNHIINFLNENGIDVIKVNLEDDTFLPGLQLKEKTILVDDSKLKYPGELLHEAGHIAVTEKQMRPLIGTKAIGKNWPSKVMKSLPYYGLMLHYII